MNEHENALVFWALQVAIAAIVVFLAPIGEMTRLFVGFLAAGALLGEVTLIFWRAGYEHGRNHPSERRQGDDVHFIRRSRL